MAIQSGLFRSNGGDRKYKAAFFASYFASFIGNGVFPNPSSGLQVMPSSNLDTVVRPGKGWINGYYMINDSDYTLSHDIADGVLSRIDRVVMRLDFLTREIGIYIKKGLPSSTPTAPTLQRDNDIYELALADVRINNGATTLNAANITDQRLNSSLCGIVQGVVNQVDTTTIFNQYQNALIQLEVEGQRSFEQFLTDKQQQFDIFFQSIQDILDGDVAANLAAQIIRIDNDLILLDNKINLHLDQNASTTQKGHVQLSNDTNSTSETLAPTMKALNEVKLLADNNKTSWANVIGSPLNSSDTTAQLTNKTQTLKETLATNLSAKGQASVGSENLQSLVDKVASISTGRRVSSGFTTAGTVMGFELYRSNITTITAPSVTVSLNFKPTLIVMYALSSNSVIGVTTYFNPALVGTSNFITISQTSDNSNLNYLLRNDVLSAYVNTAGFRLPIISGSNQVYYYAVE